MDVNFKKTYPTAEPILAARTNEPEGLVHCDLEQYFVENRFLEVRPCRTVLYKLLYIAQGTGHLIVDTITYKLSSNSLHCIFPNQVHFLKLKEGVRGHLITFPETFMSQSLYSFRQIFNAEVFTNSPGLAQIEFFGESREDVENVMVNISRQCRRDPFLREEILREYMTILFFILKKELRDYSEGNILKKTEVASKFFDLIKSGYSKKEQVSDYASLLRVSPNYLNNVVKKISGYPVSHHIQQRVLLEAKRQAVHTNMSMKEIAFYLGFEESSHFSKFFKKLTGNNFTEFRKLSAQGSFLPAG